jgi:DMSO/TMAO reductase YedYZ molybdopterin-dependent catalytic subunit
LTLAACGRGLAQTTIDLPLSGGPRSRPISADFPEKAAMIVQRFRPPLLETPFEVFDEGVFTPNERFYVRWHWADLPTRIDVDAFRLAVRGEVERALSLGLSDIVAMPQFEIAAVNQCSGNSRGFFQPSVAGGEWGNGGMGNARWLGVRLKDVLDRAGVKAGARFVRFRGLDGTVVPEAPRFMKSLDIDHARDGEVMVAYAMNGAQLPMLNGFPLRLVVPGWYGTYWIKSLNDIEALAAPDDNFWMKSAYLIPDAPQASMKPGEPGVKFVPITRMVPRSFITNLRPGQTIAPGKPVTARGVAFGGDAGVDRVELSMDDGKSWTAAKLGADEGKYSFRRFEMSLTPSERGALELAVRCVNSNGVVQPDEANWNPAGFMRNVIEKTFLIVA